MGASLLALAKSIYYCVENLYSEVNPFKKRISWLLILIHKNYQQLLVGCQVVKLSCIKRGEKS